ncbi:LysR family transcriptional regulator [Kitasatospora herbaricolor]|uniref:LysR family transcriptional regulator n=1 Tax=Kitasatospora herbaricolor TaxID=68217 RepID=UPI00174A1B05|nr:LysR family transcriptional regulator [Kitasatospora herbaricolor]MDQ0307336.1 DNA-binding transcriptional LysR family regulator [Kitasatospora herbaricolor]GGV30649.1 LysR family transcriptional regulator [Kitasatospora herbaricolor]
MFDTRHIKTFHEVVRTGSYSAAARELGYTQPAVTQQMKALERSVGVPLFARSGRGLRLTEAGEALARHAELILGSLSAAQQQLTALARLRAGRVRVCAFPSATATLIPSAIARLLAEHPGVRVELHEAEPPDSVRRLLRGECDIALAFSYPGPAAGPPEGVEEIPLMEDLLTVLLPVGHPLGRRHAVRLADLAEERWIAGCPRCRANLLHVCAEQGFEPDVVFSTDDNLAVQSLVAAGVGVALMPALVLSFMCHRKVTGRAVEPHLRRKVSAFVLREHRAIPATTLVLDSLRTAAAARSGC